MDIGVCQSRKRVVLYLMKSIGKTEGLQGIMNKRIVLLEKYRETDW